MKLIDKKKFLYHMFGKADTKNKLMTKDTEITVTRKIFEEILSKHLKDIVDEPQHPSGMDNDKIKIRNDLRKELRGE